MSDTSIFKQRKSASSQRSRTTAASKNHGRPLNLATSDQEDSPSTLATKLKNKNKNKNKKLKTRLSFGADADQDEDSGGEAFKVKKSSLSHKLTLGLHPSSPSLSTNNEGPKYDAESLKQLKASTPQSRTPVAQSHSYDADISMNIDELSMSGLKVSGDDLPASLIPAESSIKAAKEKRGRLRDTMGSEEFISLSVVQRTGSDDGPHPESRLVREEDELGEGDDEYAEYTSAQERIALGKKSRKVEANNNRNVMREMIADAEEEDEETMEWEQEQLRRGGHRTPESSSPQAKQEYKAAPIPQPTPLPSLSTAVARLTQAMTTLTSSHSSNTAALAALSDERLQQENRESELRDMVTLAEEKRSWFVAFREWVETVATFLDEKFPQLEGLEQEHLSLLRERFDMISKRRRLDDEDDLSTFLPRKQALREDDAPNLDEFGRAVQKPTSATRRVERMSRRAHRLSITPHRKDTEVEEGFSTDSSLSSPDQDAYNDANTRVKKKAKSLLDDVRAAEFREPMCQDGLAGWWGKWRERWEETYVNAWGGLGLIGALEFWTRLELVGWNCIQEARSLDSFQWYQGLYTFSCPAASDDVRDPAEVDLGPDGDLVSAMISTAVIPRLCKVLESGALDVYSSKHMHRLTDLAEELESSIEEGNLKYQMLFNSIHTAFSSSIAATESLIAEFDIAQDQALPFNPEAIPARRRFMVRQVKMLRNMLRWKRYSKGRFGLGDLVIRVLKSTLRIAETGWDVGGEELMRQIMGLVPSELHPYELVTKLA